MKPFIPPHQRKGKNGFDFNEENSTFEPRATQDIMDPKENFWDSWLVIIQIFGMSMFWAQGVKHALLDAMCCSVLNNYCFNWESVLVEEVPVLVHISCACLDQDIYYNGHKG